MNKILLLITGLSTLVFVSSCSLLGSAMGGSSADVQLTYTRYPIESFGKIKNVAVIPFEEGSLERGGGWSLWDYLDRKYASSSLPIVMADDLANKLAAKNIFKLFDRNIARNDASIEMVITGLVTIQDVVNDVKENSYTDKQGYRHYSYDAVCTGVLAVNYRFINPKTGEIMKTESIEKRYTSNASDSSRHTALSKLPERSRVLNILMDQVNTECISSFTPVEISANYALATIKDDEIFKKSLIAAKKNDWTAAVDIWSGYENSNSKEAFYNKMLYIRYVEKNLNDAITYASTAYQKSGDAGFAKWSEKFQREQKLQEEYMNPSAQSTQTPVEPDVQPLTPASETTVPANGGNGIEAGY